jgi:CDP-glycerol glycerophosphotransferase
MARISVVVPIYNVARYLGECLESLAQQTVRDLEIIMVNDGSTDGSPQIAEGFGARDPRFQLVHQANAGLGAARNTGAEHATGEFIAFVDSDDVVPRNAYELLLGALDRTASDFASGNVRRLTPHGTASTGFLNQAFRRTQLRTHITRYPYLLADRTAWNKLFRRSFWDRHGLRFPRGVFYEDTPVMLPAHYLADSVDVLEQTVYLWRMRSGGDLSITQRRAECKMLRDRIAAVDHVSRFLADRGLRISKAVYDRSVVGGDLRLFLDVLPNADDEYRRLFISLVNDYIDRADPWVLDQRLAIDRLKWALVRRRALPELLEVLRFEEEEFGERPPLQVGRHWYGDFPFRAEKRLRLPRRVFRLEDELAPVFRLNDVRWTSGVLRIEGYAYVNMLGAPERDSQRVELIARQASWPRRRIRLWTEAVNRPDVTQTAAQQFAGLDWSGFVATLDPTALGRTGAPPEGRWEIGVVIHAGALVRSSWHPTPAWLHPAPTAEGVLANGSRLTTALTTRGNLLVEIRRRPPVVHSYAVEEGVLQLEGETGSARESRAALRLSHRTGEETLEYPAYIDQTAERPTFVARVPLEDLLRVELDEGGPDEGHADTVEWDVSLAGDGGLSPVALAGWMPESAWTVNGRQIAVRGLRDGALVLFEGSPRPIVTELKWSSPGSLAVAGTFTGRETRYELLLRARSRAETHAFPLEWDARAGRFHVELALGAVTTLGETHPLGEGVWQLTVRARGKQRARDVPVLVGKTLLGTLPIESEVGAKRFRVGVLDDELVVAAERDLAADERGGVAQRRLRTSFYAKQREQPLLDAVVYECFGGREYSDSPRAVHEELVRRDAPLEHVWVVRDAAFAVPETARPVRKASREYYEALSQARYLVANDYWPRWLARRPEQVCVQTWHGVPLKRSGHDLADWSKAVRQYRRVLGQREENWQYVVSPGAFATPILKRAFPAGTLLETGLPRNDLVAGGAAERLRAAAKARLGLGERRVVLYAPTYRDDLDYRLGYRTTHPRDVPTYAAELGFRDGYRLGRILDLGTLAAALGPDDVVLVRKHPRVTDALPLPPNGAVRDVSAYGDAVGLLLAADVLVTDYSSLAFDFASTGRPIVLYTPDLDDFGDRIRGLTIDWEAAAPTPPLREADAVLDAVRRVDDFHAEHRKRYEAFVAAYCTLNDGRASGRVVDLVFEW